MTVAGDRRRDGDEAEDASRFAQHLAASGIVQRAAVERAQNLAEQSGERFVAVLSRLGLIGERELAAELARFLELQAAAAADYPLSPILEDQLQAEFLRRVGMIPLSEEADEVRLAVLNPFDRHAARAVRFALGKPVVLSVAAPADFEAAFARLYEAAAGPEARDADGFSDARVEEDVDRLRDIASNAPVVRLVNGIIAQAVEARASDIHIEPMDSELRIRLRIDGVLKTLESPPAKLASAVVSRVKIMAKLNIAERRLPQDGRIATAVRGKDIDLRVATVPTIHGEAVAIRILDRGEVELDLPTLGFDPELLARFDALLARPQGILLVTGPTGSGKTTTLYSALTKINTVDRKILTIEDPVEYHLAGINQVQVKQQIGLGFADALRSLLRHDPDILMIGEIRDFETAQIAVQAALTGHLILSTLHTNDAPSAVTRLLDMGLQDYLLSSTLNGVVAQRLVRRLCPQCRDAYEPSPALAARLGLAKLANGAPLRLWHPRGCAACRQTGYSGRSALLEIVVVDEPIRQAILRRPDSGAVRALAIAGGMETMATHGLRKALAGVTSLEEVMRVVSVD